MKKLIKMYNEKYGDALGVIDDDFNKEQMYRIYYFIKNNCEDKEIQDRIKMITLDKPKTLEQQLTKLESENGKVNSSSDEFKEFTFDEELSTDAIKYVNINTLIPRTRYKLSNDDYTTKRVIIYYRIPKSTDKIDLINIVLSPKQYEFYCNTLSKTKANIFVRSYIYSSVSYRITLGDTLDTCSVETKAYVLSSNNSFEFTPTREEHPANKKYVDEKFLTGEIETIITIPKAELDKCNNGTNGIVSTQSFSKFDVSNYIYYAHYGDKVIKMTYDDRFNQLSIDELDKNKGTSIGLLLQLNDNRIIPFNSGLAEVQSYVFTNDIIITGNKLLKKYVDDNAEYINYNNKQLNNKITSLNISRNPVSCSTEINKKPLCELFPELLNMTYNVVFKKSISFKVNMDNFAKDYPTVKSAYNKINFNLYDENGNSIGIGSYGSYINGEGLNTVFINATENIRFSAYFDKALVNDSDTTMETKNGYMTIQFLIPKGNNKKEFIDKIKNLKLSISVFKTDFLNLNNESIYTPTNDYNPATKKYVDDKVSSLPQLSFNDNGELVVTINGVSKTFVPKSE